MGMADKCFIMPRGSSPDITAMSSPKKSRVNGGAGGHLRIERQKQIQRLYAKPLRSARTGPLYNAFSYPTKISPEAIALFIATHTKPGDTVLDVFAGSGTTGLAALLCDRPTEELKRLAREVGVNPVWGPRKAILYELGTLGAFVSRTMCNPPDPSMFETTAKKFIAAAEKAAGPVYEVDDPFGRVGQLRHAIWSDVLVCPQCKKESLFSDVAVKRNPIRFVDEFGCPHCNKKTNLDLIKRATEKTFDPLIGQYVTRKKRRPAMVFGRTNGKTWQRRANSGDTAKLRETENLELPSNVPVMEMVWGDLRRNGYHTGITHIHHFYTRRNLFVLATLWKTIDQFSPDIQDALRLLVLSYNSTHSTLMTRVVVKNGQKDFVLTGAQSGVLYVSSLPVEKNIFAGLRRKIGVFRDAFTTVHGSHSKVTVVNSTSTTLSLDRNSVDYVFTDPPFGDYIPYAELNQINEAWLGKTTARRDEIIISNSQKKDSTEYSRLMGFVFSEVSRVMRVPSQMTVVFHSAKASVWKALTDAYTHAGFSVKAGSILDKVQVSFKQVVSNVSVKGDPLLLLTKTDSDLKVKNRRTNSDAIVREMLATLGKNVANAKERTAERLYSRYILNCLQDGVAVAISAESFYDQVRALERI
jgi:hypothetical protein